MDYSKNKKPPLPPLKPTKFKAPKKAGKKPRIWMLLLGCLLILAGILLLLSITQKDGKKKEGQEISVPYDIQAVREEQKSVDEGHSPWKLDPLYVTQVFVSLKISPGGIDGDYPIQREELKVIRMTKEEATVQVTSRKTNIFLVHLKRLIRKDETGIWTVVAYETAEENRENIPQPTGVTPQPTELTPQPSKEIPKPTGVSPQPTKETPAPAKENPKS